MAYTSFEELIADASSDPKLARMRVAQAKQEGIPVVSKDNSGYRSRAIAKRLGTQKEDPKKTSPTKVKYTNSVLKNRMKQAQSPAATEDDESEKIVAKRKKVGY